MSCRGKPDRISGQVFIVKGEGETIKLGLVDISLIDEKQIVEWLAKKNAAFTNEVAARRATRLKAYHDLASIDEERSHFRKTNREPCEIRLEKSGTLTKKITELLTGPARSAETVLADLARNRGELRVIEREMKEIESKGAQLDEAVEKAKAEFETAAARVEEFPSLRFYFGDFPTATVAETTTDADGKFTLSISKRGRFGILANAPRLFGEHYCWFFWLPKNGSEKPVLLNNKNLIFTDYPQNVLPVTPKL